MTEPSAACEQLTKPRLLYRRTAMLDTGMQASTDGAGCYMYACVLLQREWQCTLSLSLSLSLYSTKLLYQGGPKNWVHKLMAIVLSNLNRFTFFHTKIPWKICGNLVTENPTAPRICCHTTLWNINVRKQATNDRLRCSIARYLRCGVESFSEKNL